MGNAVISEIEDYRTFTKPAELHKAINTLQGIVGGITMSNGVNDAEIHELFNWCVLHAHLQDRHPFNELIPMIQDAQSDNIITSDEVADILWLCNNFLTESTYYDDITSALQYLLGLLHGILADNEVSDREIQILREWMDAHSFLRGCYPFDEIDSLLVSVLSDGKIDSNEKLELKAFFSNFVDLSSSYNLNEVELNSLRSDYCLEGICAACPEIKVNGSLFCFTGQSRKAKRQEIANIIETHGGAFNNNVTKKTNYLIVGNAGNPCWAYACYGRKVEEAVNLRKSGNKILIVNETDFWDILEE